MCAFHIPTLFKQLVTRIVVAFILVRIEAEMKQGTYFVFLKDNTISAQALWIIDAIIGERIVFFDQTHY